MNVGRSRYNYYGFYEKSTYQMSINRGRTNTTQGAYISLMGILFFFSISLLVKRFEVEIQLSEDCMDIVRG